MPDDDYANLIYIHLAMDEGSGQSLKVRRVERGSRAHTLPGFSLRQPAAWQRQHRVAIRFLPLYDLAVPCTLRLLCRRGDTPPRLRLAGRGCCA